MFLHFCGVHFASGEKQILETRCIEQHAFLDHPLVFSLDVFAPRMFLDSQEGRRKPRKGIVIWLPHRNFALLDLPEAHPDRKGGQKECTPSFERRKGPRASRPPCMCCALARFEVSRTRRLDKSQDPPWWARNSASRHASSQQLSATQSMRWIQVRSFV